MVVVLFGRNVVNVYWSLYWRVVKNQPCGASLGKCKAARYQVTNYTILVFTSGVSVLREEKCHTQVHQNLLTTLMQRRQYYKICCQRRYKRTYWVAVTGNEK